MSEGVTNHVVSAEKDKSKELSAFSYAVATLRKTVDSDSFKRNEEKSDFHNGSDNYTEYRYSFKDEFGKKYSLTTLRDSEGKAKRVYFMEQREDSHDCLIAGDVDLYLFFDDKNRPDRAKVNFNVNESSALWRLRDEITKAGGRWSGERLARISIDNRERSPKSQGLKFEATFLSSLSGKENNLDQYPPSLAVAEFSSFVNALNKHNSEVSDNKIQKSFWQRAMDKFKK